MAVRVSRISLCIFMIISVENSGGIGLGGSVIDLDTLETDENGFFQSENKAVPLLQQD
jgi:hypothetical protein